MPEWLAPTAGCVIVLALVYLASRDESAVPPRGAAKARPATEGDPSEEEGFDSGKRTTVEAKRDLAEKEPPPSEDLAASPKKKNATPLPKLDYEEDADIDPTKVGTDDPERPILQAPTRRIVYDEDAATEDPTSPGALILVTATAQTDKGVRRKRNEDNLLVMADEGVYVVADGMGGYRGGEIASEIAVGTIEEAFSTHSFPGDLHESIPTRASELARAIQMANDSILARAQKQPELTGMGTTVCAARFSPNKQRLYVAHVGDSRLYRLRQGKLHQMTSDHTMKDFGVTGEGSAHLSRAVGVWPTVPIDIVLGKPLPNDRYLLCSDGLTKMLDDETIAAIASKDVSPSILVDELVAAANARGGKDNITIILIRVFDPAEVERVA